MLLVSNNWGKRDFVRRFGPEHASPNSGYPEAALAAVLEKHLKQKAVLVADLSSAPELKVQLSQQVEAILFSLMMMKMLRMKRHLSG